MAYTYTVDTRAYEFFGSRDMFRVVEGISLAAARSTDAIAKAELLDLLAFAQDRLAAIARGTSAEAEKRMRENIDKTKAERGPQGDRPGHPHLRNLVKAEPQIPELGTVDIGVIEGALDQHPGWLFQEIGSREVYPGFVGHILYGVFSGDFTDAPRERFGRHVIGKQGYAPGGSFTPAPYSEGGGLGMVRNDVQPRHYIQDAANDTWPEYKTAIEELSRELAHRLDLIGEQAILRASVL